MIYRSYTGSMKRIFVFCCVVMLSLDAMGQAAERHIFEEAFNASLAQGAFKPGAHWVPYPAYSDRATWEKLGEGYKEDLIKLGEEFLGHVWKPTLASTYLEYEKTGNRKLMDEHNRTLKAVALLTVAELLEGKGRFLPHLLDGLWMVCTEVSWSHAEHVRYQSSKRTLPVDGERPITLHSSNYGMNVAFALHFFKEEFDKLDPSIAVTIKNALRKNILDPYLDPKMKLWWMGGTADSRRLNNWSTYCTNNVATVFLLCEDNPDRLVQALKQSVVTMDMYMNDQGSDGACDEGPSYWDMGPAKVYEYVRLMADASHGKMNVLGDDFIRKMGEFKSKTYFDDGYVMNFADGGCRDEGDLALMYRYGADTGSKELVDFAISQFALPSKNMFKPYTRFAHMYRILETLRYSQSLRETQEKTLAEYDGNFARLKSGLRENVGSVWYDQTQYAILRKGEYILAAKAGNNAENHNHNDVGSGILFANGRPVIVDPGVGTYVKDTFGPNRYKIWNNQSDWHSVPVINGFSQIKGAEYAATDVSCDLDKGEFKADIAGAYPKESACISWERKWMLTEDGLVLVDTYEMSERTVGDVENFIIRGDVYLPGETTADGYKVAKGEIAIRAYSYSKKGKVDLLMTYPKDMTPSITVQDLSIDKKIQKAWGEDLKRVSFASKSKAPLKGQYEFRVKIL